MANAERDCHVIMASYTFCFHEYYTLAEMITYMNAKHGVDERNVVDDFVQIKGSLEEDYDKKAEKQCARREMLKAKYEWCFKHFFKVDEVVKMMQSEYGEGEEKVTRDFGSLLVTNKADHEYHTEAEKRSAKRQKRAKKKKKKKEEKNKVKERDASTLPLFEALSDEDKETLRYLINNSQQGTPLPIIEAAHEEERFDCYCFHCYGRYWNRCLKSEHHNEMNSIIESLDNSTEEDPAIAQAKSEEAFGTSCAEISSFWC